jgi:hypothetical protein
MLYFLELQIKETKNLAIQAKLANACIMKRNATIVIRN